MFRQPRHLIVCYRQKAALDARHCPDAVLQNFGLVSEGMVCYLVLAAILCFLTVCCRWAYANIGTANSTVMRAWLVSRRTGLCEARLVRFGVL